MDKDKNPSKEKIQEITQPTEIATQNIAPATEIAKGALEDIITTLRHKAASSELDKDEVKSLSHAVESLLKLYKEDREEQDKYRDLSDTELLKLARKAAKVLKKQQQ